MESSMGKNPGNYESIKNKTNIYEQEPINIDDFNKAEETDVKPRVEKQKGKKWLKKTIFLEEKESKKKQKLRKRTCGSVCQNLKMNSRG